MGFEGRTQSWPQQTGQFADGQSCRCSGCGFTTSMKPKSLILFSTGFLYFRKTLSATALLLLICTKGSGRPLSSGLTSGALVHPHRHCWASIAGPRQRKGQQLCSSLLCSKHYENQHRLYGKTPIRYVIGKTNKELEEKKKYFFKWNVGYWLPGFALRQTNQPHTFLFLSLKNNCYLVFLIAMKNT